MSTNHIQRINDDIQRALSSALRKVKDPRVQQGTLLSVLRCDTTGDLRYCKVYLSVLGEVDEKAFMKGLKSCAPWLRRELGASLSLRYTPELLFQLDHSIEQGAHISQLIENLNVSTEEDEAE